MIVRLTGALLLVRFFAPILVAIFAYITLSQFLGEVATVVNNRRPTIEQDLSIIRSNLSTVQNELDNLRDEADTVMTFMTDLNDNITLPTIPTNLDFSGLILPTTLRNAAEFEVFGVSILSILQGIDVPIPFSQTLRSALSDLRGTFGNVTAPFDNLSLVSDSLSQISDSSNNVWIQTSALMNDLDSLMSNQPTKDNPNPGGWAQRLHTLLLIVLGCLCSCMYRLC